MTSTPGTVADQIRPGPRWRRGISRPQAFGGRLAIAARWLAGAEQFLPRLGPAAGVKHLRWHAPVVVGDTLTFRGWAERKIVLATQKEWGLLVVGAEGVDQSGRLVVSFYPQMLLERNAVPASPVGETSQQAPRK